MRRVTYTMNVSLDGYVTDPDGSLDWSTPSDEVFRFHIEEIRKVDVHLLGRRLYETMRYWETVDQDPDTSEDELEWAALWNPLPKVVFSNSLSEVDPSSRLASGDLAEEIERLRAEPGGGEIAIGGPNLASQAAELGLIDEYRMVVYPTLVGGGTPYFPHGGSHVALELLETRTFEVGAIYLRYRLVR